MQTISLNLDGKWQIRTISFHSAILDIADGEYKLKDKSGVYYFEANKKTFFLNYGAEVLSGFSISETEKIKYVPTSSEIEEESSIASYAKYQDKLSKDIGKYTLVVSNG